ncbi:MAG: hypothetical protein ABL901_10175 [Hyphomicrobiaceae bacterium]
MSSQMKTYRVQLQDWTRWETEVHAQSPQAAAVKARHARFKPNDRLLTGSYRVVGNGLSDIHDVVEIVPMHRRMAIDAYLRFDPSPTINAGAVA